MMVQSMTMQSHWTDIFFCDFSFFTLQTNPLASRASLIYINDL